MCRNAMHFPVVRFAMLFTCTSYFNQIGFVSKQNFLFEESRLTLVTKLLGLGFQSVRITPRVKMIQRVRVSNTGCPTARKFFQGFSGYFLPNFKGSPGDFLLSPIYIPFCILLYILFPLLQIQAVCYTTHKNIIPRLSLTF